MRVRFQLPDKPLHVQLVQYIGSVAQLDFGTCSNIHTGIRKIVIQSG